MAALSPKPAAGSHASLQMCCVSDVAHGLRAFQAFFQTISELDRTGGSQGQVAASCTDS
jgi:hypothetical protein